MVRANKANYLVTYLLTYLRLRYKAADLSAVDSISIHKQNGLDPFAFKILQLRPNHVQHVAMGHERAREVEADGTRLFFRRFMKFHDSSPYVASSDSEHPHSVDDWVNVVRAAATRPTVNSFIIQSIIERILHILNSTSRKTSLAFSRSRSFDEYFTLRADCAARGHEYKLFVNYSRLNIRKHFYCESSCSLE